MRRVRRHRPLLSAVVTVVSLLAGGTGMVPALTVDELPPDADYRVGDVDVSSDALPGDEVRAILRTETRPWYTPWADRPAFDPLAFRTDLDRVVRFAESRGYFEAWVAHELTVHPDGIVDIEVTLETGEPIRVGGLEIVAEDPDAARVLRAMDVSERLALQRGDVFVESEYQLNEEVIRAELLEAGYARATTTRSAEVDLATNTALVRYQATAGPLTSFGQTTVSGSGAVDPDIVTRELAYEPGERFSVSAIEESRASILDLQLFRAVRFTLQRDAQDPYNIPVEVAVEPRAPRELRIGIGYSTDEGPRGQLEWIHRNWLGGGRQLSLLLKASMITTEVRSVFVQPHLFAPSNRGVLEFRLYRDDEQTYTQAATRLVPRLEHRFTEDLVGYVQYRAELDKLTDVDPSAVRALGGVKRDGFLSAPGVGLEWNTADDPLDASTGHVVTLDVEQAGEIWGGHFAYVRTLAEGRKYLPIGWETVLALRLKIGFADSIGALENLPLFERLYAGGQRSVRGYGRRRLGPLSANDNPLGGRSLVEGSIEVRRPIWGPLGGALFLDFGQVSLDAWDPPVNDLKFAPGFGLTYATPLGPLRLDIGFPIDPPPEDQAFQLHFSIGQFF